MRTHTHWARFAIASVTLSASIAACDSVLDIQDPKMRPSNAGASGDPSGATDAGGNSSGSGGTNGIDTPMGGAGQGGDMPVAGTDAGGGGEGGAPVMKDCEPDALQCGGANQNTPLVCDETGHWIANTNEADGDCPVLCGDGKCTECEDQKKRCTVCADDAAGCDANLPQTCVDGVWTDDKKACSQYCDSGVCKTARSCDQFSTGQTTCDQGQSCCNSLLVPGGNFKRDFDSSPDYGDDSYSAQISPFYLDKFEVTVGRMRQFVTAYAELNLKDGAGESANSADDQGWDHLAYVLPANQDALTTQLKCAGTTWSDAVDMNNTLPMNCATFNVAYAFCIWDGGRLPTEAEWNFAAAGGHEQRAYPWKAAVSGPAITDEYANYGNANPGPLAVGSKPLGNGRWGQSDLAGNLAERTLDFRGDYPTVCENCFNATPAVERTWRGGSYVHVEDFLRVSYRGGVVPAASNAVWGFRCARDLK